jgi:SAM-dependent methyltransferase
MHDTALITGKSFAQVYGKAGMTVVDVGGLNLNGSLRDSIQELGMKYICVDLEEDWSVDMVVKPGEPLPFDDSSIDLVVSTSCFEHDPCFWITFKELCRIVKLDGYIYVNAPSNGYYHGHPGDNWRFYYDFGQALAYWASKKMCFNEKVYPVKVEETFHVLPLNDPAKWIDAVCVWKRVNELTNEFKISEEIFNKKGNLEIFLTELGLKLKKKMK